MWHGDKLAASVHGTWEPGDGRVVRGVAPIREAGATDLTFCAGETHKTGLHTTKAAVIVLQPGVEAPAGAGVIRSEDPRKTFELLLGQMYPEPVLEPIIHALASVHPEASVDGARVDAFAVVEEGAQVSAGAWIMAHAYVGSGVVVGRDCTIAPHAVLMSGVTLGERVEIQPGAVLGSRGFGYKVDDDGVRTMPHVGTVHIGDDVVIGANSCVDQAPLGTTHIGPSTKTDNLVQVGHGARVGAQSLLAAYAGISGSATLGRRVTMGGRAGVVQGVALGDDVTLGGATTATKDIADGQTMVGFPAQPRSRWLRERAWVRAGARRVKRDSDDT